MTVAPSLSLYAELKSERCAVNIIFERDSVCAGDDVLAPNRAAYHFDDTAVWLQVLSEDILFRYLPSVFNAKTFWYVLSDGDLVAEVTHTTVTDAGVDVRLLKPNRIAKGGRLFFQYVKQETLQ